MKIFLKNIHLLNFLLIALIGIFAQYLFLPSHTIESMNPLPSAQQSREAGEETVTETEIPSPAEYTVVADENLFHPERKIPVEKKEEQPLPKPDFVLYGTLISDTVTLAYMEDLKSPLTSPGRGKRQRALKQGDTLSGFTVKEIDTERIIMARGEEKIVVSIHDPSHPKDRIASAGIETSPDQSRAAAKKASSRQKEERVKTPSVRPARSQNDRTASSSRRSQDISKSKDPRSERFRPQR